MLKQSIPDQVSVWLYAEGLYAIMVEHCTPRPVSAMVLPFTLSYLLPSNTFVQPTEQLGTQETEISSLVLY